MVNHVGLFTFIDMGNLDYFVLPEDAVHLLQGLTILVY